MNRTKSTRTVGFAALIVFASVAAVAQDTPGTLGNNIRQYQFDIRVVQVLTNITGDGLTSQTLPGIPGSYQVLHESLDGVKLVMDGESLTWNGKDAPEEPRIELMAAPKVITSEDAAATIAIKNDNDPQYFERKDGGLFELKTWTPGDSPVGIELMFTPIRSKSAPDVLDCDFSFRYSWIKDREPIEGVHLPVGKPIADSVQAKGKLGCRVGQWTCYRTILSGEGVIYVFVKATEHKPADAGHAANP